MCSVQRVLPRQNILLLAAVPVCVCIPVALSAAAISDGGRMDGRGRGGESGS